MVKTLGDVHEDCLQNKQSMMPQVVALAHFDLLTKALGSEWRAIKACPKEIQKIFPEKVDDTNPVLTSIGGLRVYQSCGRALLKLIVELTEGEADDPFRTLRILGGSARVGSGLSDLKAPLVAAFGADVDLSKIDREAAIRVDSGLEGIARQRFRKALANLDALRALPTVQERGLLSTEMIGALPAHTSTGLRLQAIPPQLSQFCAQMKASDKTAFKAAYSIAVQAGVFDTTEDIFPTKFLETGIQDKLRELLVSRYPGKTGRVYYNRIINAVRRARFE